MNRTDDFLDWLKKESESKLVIRAALLGLSPVNMKIKALTKSSDHPGDFFLINYESSNKFNYSNYKGVTVEKWASWEAEKNLQLLAHQWQDSHHPYCGKMETIVAYSNDFISSHFSQRLSASGLHMMLHYATMYGMLREMDHEAIDPTGTILRRLGATIQRQTESFNKAIEAVR